MQNESTAAELVRLYGRIAPQRILDKIVGAGKVDDIAAAKKWDKFLK